MKVDFPNLWQSTFTPEELEEVLSRLKSRGANALKQGTRPNKNAISFTFCFRGTLGWNNGLNFILGIDFLNWVKNDKHIDKSKAKQLANVCFEDFFQFTGF